MKANTVKLAEIFGAHTRYRVPLFQRPYVWEKDKQWQPLWDDLREVAERQTDINPANDTFAHFMGAIVVDQEVNADSLNTRLLIDGQQRLTTLQLVIAAARVLAQQEDEQQTIAKLEALLFIPAFLLKDPKDRLSLTPTNYDRAAFAAAIEFDGKPASPLSKNDSAHILTAYSFFRGAIAEWLEEESEDSKVEKLRALAQTLWDLLRLVVIALEHGDDAQAIFETLNARGTPLLAADLVKNFLFRGIENQGGELASQQAYDKYWSRFDQRPWREEVGQGRARRPRIDILLTYWIMLESQEEVNFQAVFEAFSRHIRGADPQAVLQRLDATAEVYEGFRGLDPYGTEGTFFHRLDVLESTTFMPAVLFMFGPTGIRDKGSRETALRAIESWLVRRMICRMTTKNYNTVALGLLRELSSQAVPSGEVVVDYLLRQSGESQRWPDDDDVREAVRTVPFYTTITRRRLRMVLDAIEASMHDSKVGPFADRDRLTIEHVLPQSWEMWWPLPAAGDQLQNRIDRDMAKHRLGNLALVTQGLNSALSNAPWVSGQGPSKREALRRYSQYLINKDVIDEPGWDESRIVARGEKFAKIILQLWPKPASAGAPAKSPSPPSEPGPTVEPPPATSTVAEPAALPGGVVATIARYPEFTRHLAIDFAHRALRIDGVTLRAQKSKNTPGYYQVRHPKFRQVVAYVNMGQDGLDIDYRLPSEHITDLGVTRRPGNFYGIRLRARAVADLAPALQLLADALGRA